VCKVDGAKPAAAERCGDLVFPERLTPEEQGRKGV
jgi:hypothetical protein